MAFMDDSKSSIANSGRTRDLSLLLIHLYTIIICFPGLDVLISFHMGKGMSLDFWGLESLESPDQVAGAM